jgi:hypothetical protein
MIWLYFDKKNSYFYDLFFLYVLLHLKLSYVQINPPFEISITFGSIDLNNTIFVRFGNWTIFALCETLKMVHNALKFLFGYSL